MKYAICKLYFSTGVHIGKSALADGECTINSDTIFSALCHEALKTGGENHIEKLTDLSKDNLILISDALPFIEEDLYVPKPLQPVDNQGNEHEQDDSIKKKAYKKLKYISIDMLDTYMEGNLDPETEVEILKNLGSYELRTKAWINGTDETKPYFLGVYNFKTNNGLYIVIAYKEKEDLEFIENLIKGLGYIGIGGKRSSGLGKFKPELFKPSDEFINHISNDKYESYMTLSSCMATPSELEGVIENSYYLLHKRSGFVSSESYSDRNLKKKDFYTFKAGSCFSSKFYGDIYDVSYKGNHPVYRYAKPMFLGVK